MQYVASNNRTRYEKYHVLNIKPHLFRNGGILCAVYKIFINVNNCQDLVLWPALLPLKSLVSTYYYRSSSIFI